MVGFMGLKKGVKRKGRNSPYSGWVERTARYLGVPIA